MECKEFLLSRRSIRYFQEKQVPLETLLQALDIARYAPSAKNLQPWEFIIITNREKLRELSKIHIGAKPLERTNVAIVVLADKHASPISYLIDGAIVATYLWLALHCIGLGAVWIQTLRNIEDIRNILSIPENLIPIAILAIGYPAEKPVPKPRKDLRNLVHINTYGNKLETT